MSVFMFVSVSMLCQLKVHSAIGKAAKAYLTSCASSPHSHKGQMEGGQNGWTKCQQGNHVKLQVNSKYVAEDLVADFDAGLEYAEAECLLDVQHRGDSRQYLVR